MAYLKSLKTKLSAAIVTLFIVSALGCPRAEELEGRTRTLQDAGFLDAAATEAALTDLRYRDLAFIDVQQTDAGIADRQMMQDAAQWRQALASPAQMSLQDQGQCKRLVLMAEPAFSVSLDAGAVSREAGSATLEAGSAPLNIVALKPLAAYAPSGLLKVTARSDGFRVCAQVLPDAEERVEQVMLQAQDASGENFSAQVAVHIYAEPSPFAAAVTDVQYGAGAGFGQENFPENVLGPPQGAGDMAGSMDVLSLGAQGEIVLDLGQRVIDGPGPDVLVFENPFAGFVEVAELSLSNDGVEFTPFPCDSQAPYQGCAGLRSVWANPENDRDPTNPEQAGGDAFDLAEIDLSSARYIKLRDIAGQDLGGDAAGFDLDAVAAIHRLPLPGDGDPRLDVPAQMFLRPGECAAVQADLSWGQSPLKYRLALPVEPQLESTGFASLQLDDHFVCAEAVGELDLNWTYGPLNATTRIIIQNSEDAGE